MRPDERFPQLVSWSRDEVKQLSPALARIVGPLVERGEAAWAENQQLDPNQERWFTFAVRPRGDGGVIGAIVETTGQVLAERRVQALQQQLARGAANLPDEAPPPASTAPEKEGRRVLVVEDNLEAAEMLAEYLDAIGYNSRVAKDGAAAMRIVADFAPDLALVDVALPVMDGCELGKRLKAQLKTPLKLVALTNYGQDTERVRAMASGFTAHLVKPIDLDDLTDLLFRMGNAG